MTDNWSSTPLSPYEQTIQNYYDTLWADHSRLRTRGRHWSSGWHFGYIDTKDFSSKDVIETMNQFIGETLDLSHKHSAKILDAGCGIGTTSLSLAQQYPHCDFTGLSISAAEITFATHLQHERGITNTQFLQGNFLHTTFPDASFDTVFALESASHAEDKNLFITEMDRILKPRGTLLILDLIPRKTIHLPIQGSSQLQKHAASLSHLCSLLEKTGFRIKRQEDLLKTRRVNPLEILYSTLWYSTTAYLEGTQKQTPQQFRRYMGYASLVPISFLQLLSFIYSRYGYFILLAEKTPLTSA